MAPMKAFGYAGAMATLIYRCPTTGMNVQAWFADEVSEEADEHAFVGTLCSACAQTHLVNPVTGRVAGDHDE